MYHATRLPIAADHLLRAVDILQTSDSGLLESAKDPAVAAPHGLSAWQRRKVLTHIRTHLADRLTNDELAKLTKLSIAHFCAMFRQSFGTSPHAYVLDRRVALARQMLTDTDTPISEIALTCGFADQSHLTRHFRKLIRDTPSAYRRRYGRSFCDAGELFHKMKL